MPSPCARTSPRDPPPHARRGSWLWGGGCSVPQFTPATLKNVTASGRECRYVCRSDLSLRRRASLASVLVLYHSLRLRACHTLTVSHARGRGDTPATRDLLKYGVCVSASLGYLGFSEGAKRVIESTACSGPPSVQGESNAGGGQFDSCEARVAQTLHLVPDSSVDRLRRRRPCQYPLK